MWPPCTYPNGGTHRRIVIVITSKRLWLQALVDWNGETSETLASRSRCWVSFVRSLARMPKWSLNLLLSWSSKFRLHFQKTCFPVCSSPIARLPRSLLQQPSKTIADTQPRFPVYSSIRIVLIVVLCFMEAAMWQSWHTSIRDVQELLPLTKPAWRNSWNWEHYVAHSPSPVVAMQSDLMIMAFCNSKRPQLRGIILWNTLSKHPPCSHFFLACT